MPSYRDYRRFGHSRLTAFTLSIHPVVWFALAGFAGGVVSNFL